MIGSIDPTQKKVTVIGAGISGLLIAYALKKKGFQVQILESSNEVGGVIRTLQTPYGIVEQAAHSLLVTPQANDFFKELGIELYPVNSDSRARFIYRDGKMRRVPLYFNEIVRTLITFFSRPKKTLVPTHDSLADWGNIYLGSKATEFLIAPFVTGIFASRPEELLASLAFPKLIPRLPGTSLFRHLRSRKKTARPQMMAPVNGMGSLIQALNKELKDNIQTDVSIHDLPSDTNLVLSVPAASLSKLLRKDDPHSAEALLQVKYSPLITATCFFDEKSFSKKPKGVGVLIPRGQGLRLLGCLFNSSSFPGRTTNDSTISLTAMLGGSVDPEAMKLTDEELTSLINQELRKLLHAKTPALHVQITRWDRAIPLYNSALKLAQDSLKTGFCAQNGKMVFTNFSQEVSIRSLIDSSLQV